MSEINVALIGRRYQILRRAAGVTQAQAAALAGVTRVSVTNFEAGRQDMPISRVVALCAAIGVGVGDIVETTERSAQ